MSSVYHQDDIDSAIDTLISIFNHEPACRSDVTIALRGVRGTACQSIGQGQFPLADTINASLRDHEHHSAGDALQKILPFLSWYFAGLEDGRIPEPVARRMATCEILGPRGLYYSEQVRVGLFMQSPHVDYPVRQHAAEETFFIVSGGAYWRRGGDAPAWRGPGAYIHHPSMMEHGDCTIDRPMMTVWRWTGDVRFESYRIKDDNGPVSLTQH